MSNKTCRLCLFVVYPAIKIRARITSHIGMLFASPETKWNQHQNFFFQYRWCPWWSLRARHNNNHRTILLFCLHFRKKPGLLCENFRYSTLSFSCYTRACNDHIASRDLFHFFFILKLTLFSSALQVSTSGVRNSLMFCLPHGVGEARSWWVLSILSKVNITCYKHTTYYLKVCSTITLYSI